MKNAIENFIPIHCELGGMELVTKLVNDSTNGTNLGLSNLPEGEIKLQNVWRGRVVQNTNLQNTYFHELAHTIFDSIGYYECSKDEKLVQAIADKIFEFLRTAKWAYIDNFKEHSLSSISQIAPFIRTNAVSAPLKFVTEFELTDGTKCKCLVETDKPMNKIILRDHIKNNLTTIVEGLYNSILE